MQSSSEPFSFSDFLVDDDDLYLPPFEQNDDQFIGVNPLRPLQKPADKVVNPPQNSSIADNDDLYLPPFEQNDDPFFGVTPLRPLQKPADTVVNPPQNSSMANDWSGCPPISQNSSQVVNVTVNNTIPPPAEAHEIAAPAQAQIQHGMNNTIDPRNGALTPNPLIPTQAGLQYGVKNPVNLQEQPLASTGNPVEDQINAIARRYNMPPVYYPGQQIWYPGQRRDGCRWPQSQFTPPLSPYQATSFPAQQKLPYFPAKRDAVQAMTPPDSAAASSAASSATSSATSPDLLPANSPAKRKRAATSELKRAEPRERKEAATPKRKRAATPDPTQESAGAGVKTPRNPRGAGRPKKANKLRTEKLKEDFASTPIRKEGCLVEGSEVVNGVQCPPVSGMQFGAQIYEA